jgi:hypothetical protein
MTSQALSDRYVGLTLPRLAGRSTTCRFCRLGGTSCLWRVLRGDYNR